MPSNLAAGQSRDLFVYGCRWVFADALLSAGTEDSALTEKPTRTTHPGLSAWLRSKKQAARLWHHLVQPAK